MANNKSIQILRGNSAQIVAAQANTEDTDKLLPGQMLYNTDKGYLTIGSNENNAYTQDPIKVRELIAYGDSSSNHVSSNILAAHIYHDVGGLHINEDLYGISILSSSTLSVNTSGIAINAGYIMQLNAGECKLQFTPSSGMNLDTGSMLNISSGTITIDSWNRVDILTNGVNIDLNNGSNTTFYVGSSGIGGNYSIGTSNICSFKFVDTSPVGRNCWSGLMLDGIGSNSITLVARGDAQNSPPELWANCNSNDYVYTFPNRTGTLALTSDTPISFINPVMSEAGYSGSNTTYITKYTNQQSFSIKPNLWGLANFNDPNLWYTDLIITANMVNGIRAYGASTSENHHLSFTTFPIRVYFDASFIQYVWDYPRTLCTGNNDLAIPRYNNSFEFVPGLEIYHGPAAIFLDTAIRAGRMPSTTTINSVSINNNIPNTSCTFSLRYIGPIIRKN